VTVPPIALDEVIDAAERIALERGDMDASRAIAAGWLPGKPPGVPAPCAKRMRSAWAQALVELEEQRRAEMREEIEMREGAW
jgi:hypothetical protein